MGVVENQINAYRFQDSNIFEPETENSLGSVHVL